VCAYNQNNIIIIIIRSSGNVKVKIRSNKAMERKRTYDMVMYMQFLLQLLADKQEYHNNAKKNNATMQRYQKR
jgi:hypothetical protein